MSKIKFGVCEFCFPYWGEPAIRMAHEAGFEGMQISDGGGSDYSYPLNNEWIQDRYLEASSKYDIKLHALYLSTVAKHRGMCEAPDSVEGKLARANIKNGILAAEKLGIHYLTFDYLRIYGEAAKNYMADAVRYAIEEGKDHGVQVEIEPDIPVSEQINLIESLDNQLKICFDTYNPLMYGIGYPPKMIKMLGKDRIAYFHVKDSTRDAHGFVTKETTKSLPIGQGDTFFKESAQAIKEIDYEGWLMSETFYTRPSLHEGGLDYIELARNDLETLKKEFL